MTCGDTKGFNTTQDIKFGQREVGCTIEPSSMFNHGRIKPAAGPWPTRSRAELSAFGAQVFFLVFIQLRGERS